MPSARKEALRFLIPLCGVLLVLSAIRVVMPVSGYVLFPIFLLTMATTAFVVYFFRDPERYVPADESIIVAAADGLVVGIDEMEEPDFHLGPMIRVAIFLSVFDVHINRTPCDGTVKSTVYKAGKFLDVRHPQSSQLNEARSWWLETPHGNVAVRQIAGLVARRIVAWAGEGTPLRAGQDRRPRRRRGDAHREVAGMRAKGKGQKEKGPNRKLFRSPLAFCHFPFALMRACRWLLHYSKTLLSLQ
jgi:phosphatidylserine decarboxylase